MASTSIGSSCPSRRRRSTSRSPGRPIASGSRVPSGCLSTTQHVLQGVSGRPRPVVAGVLLVEVVDQGVDRGGVRRLLGVRGGRVVEGQRCGWPHLHRLDVGGVVAGRAADVGVLADVGAGEELLGLRAAHRPGGRLHDDVVEAEPVEDPDVGVTVAPVGRLEPRIVDVEGVGVLHHELPAAQQAGPRTRLVAVLRLDLVDRQRQVLVGGVEVLDQEREHLLVRRPEQVVGALAVVQPEDAVAVLGPAAGGLVGLRGQQRREVHLLGADGVHLVADDLLDAAQHSVAQRQPGVEARGRPGGCSRRGRAAGGWAPRRRLGPRAGCARTGWTSAGSWAQGYWWAPRPRTTYRPTAPARRVRLPQGRGSEHDGREASRSR